MRPRSETRGPWERDERALGAKREGLGSETNGSWVDLKEDCRGKERGLYGETTSSDRESKGASAEGSV